MKNGSIKQVIKQTYKWVYNGVMQKKNKKTGQFVAVHNKSKHPLYKTFITMHARCYKKNNPKYYTYGKRGIIVCDRWHNIDNFIQDMGIKPSGKHSLDRIDNNKNYEPNNCRWSTPTQQANNRGMLKNNSSGVTGVGWSKQRKKWLARIDHNKKSIFIGAYTDKEEAIKARTEYEQQYKKVLAI